MRFPYKVLILLALRGSKAFKIYHKQKTINIICHTWDINRAFLTKKDKN